MAVSFPFKNLSVPIKIDVDYKQIRDGIGGIIAKVMDDAIKDSVPTITRFTRETISGAIRFSKEYQAMIHGQLSDELGVPDITSRLDRILSYWMTNISVQHTPVRLVGTRLRGGLKVTAIKANYQDVLSTEDAAFVTEHGDTLPWLEWMLLRGTSVIILDYEVGVGLGRAGNNIMVSNPGSSWSIPPEFSGIKDNNFVTRAVDSVMPTITSFIQSEISKRIV